MIVFLLPACSPRAEQEFTSQYQASAYQSTQPVIITATSSPTGSFLESLNLLPTVTITPILAAPFCDFTDSVCIIQHYFPFQRPFSSVFNTAIEVSYLYGSTQLGVLAPHHGVEITNPKGTPVLAVDDGIVVVAGNDFNFRYGPWENFYGNLVMLAHDLPNMESPVYTLYGHLSTVMVQVGQSVKGGELLGEVGDTGSAVGSHLHFEVRLGTNQYTDTRNPALWLIPLRDKNGQQYGALAGKIINGQGNSLHTTVKAEYYPDINGPREKTFYIETYAPDRKPIGRDDHYQENFALTDLQPGNYRLTLEVYGVWAEQWVAVESGKLSFVTIIPDR